MTLAGSLRSMPFAFFAAISRLRGVMDRFSGFFADEDDWATMADDCWDIMIARRRAVGTDRALVCRTTLRRAGRKRSTNRAFVSCGFDRGVEGEKFRHPSTRKVGLI